MTPSPTPAMLRTYLAARHDLIPGEEFGVGVVAALLDVSEACAEAVLVDLVGEGVLVAVEGVDDEGGSVLPGAPTPRFRRPDRSPALLPAARHPGDQAEVAAVRRLLEHVLAHATGAAEAMGPGKHRPFADELPLLPAFAAEDAAKSWFAIEGAGVLAAQRRAHELGMTIETACFGPACWPWLRDTRRHADQLAVQSLAAEAAERIDHPAAGAAHARRAWALEALGRAEDAGAALATALEVARRFDDDWTRAAALTLRGRHHRAAGCVDQAFADFHAALEVDKRRRVPGPDGALCAPRTAIGVRWIEIAETHLHPSVADPDEALHAANTALAHLSGDPRRRRELVRAHSVRGRALKGLNRPEAALAALDTAERLVDRHTEPYYLAAIMHAKGHCFTQLGDTGPAGTEYRHAAEAYRAAGRHDLATELETLLGSRRAATDA